MKYCNICNRYMPEKHFKQSRHIPGIIRAEDSVKNAVIQSLRETIIEQEAIIAELEDDLEQAQAKLKRHGLKP